MYELLQHLIAFKYACKINHWSSDKYAEHLLFDRLSENIDNWVDSISECYFMATDNKNVFQANNNITSGRIAKRRRTERRHMFIAKCHRRRFLKQNSIGKTGIKKRPIGRFFNCAILKKILTTSAVNTDVLKLGLNLYLYPSDNTPPVVPHAQNIPL